jgi:Kef-type K+ transport system membrane component KefB
MLIATAIVSYVFPFFAGDLDTVGKNKYLIFLVLMHLETILLCSILTARFSLGSIIISTQIGQLIQYFLLAFFYLCLGRFQLDIFHTKGRDKNKDWLIYLIILTVFVAAYLMVAMWNEVRCRGKQRGEPY